ncbi:PAS domain S-box protein [Roseomonas sp. E05]|uniref:hybrid sensor histidine kinase/response regulator n=1 Tax=Roseomonas sp. E05 TaxID=3046310 RepID=UPI0024BBD735|nr:PAS domain S-box protein [Roseomonas sp. E05]MDJ0391649.1 PAS domain S-box protein [Roseomonas sp. E05]
MTSYDKAPHPSQLSPGRLAELVLESVADFAILTTDLAGIITSWNSSAEAAMGWRAEEAIGQDACMIFTPEDQASGACAEEMAIARRDGRAADERWHLRKDGSRFWGAGSMTRLEDRDTGAHIGYVKIVRDRTEQHEAGQRLIRSEARSGTMLGIRTVGIIVWGPGFGLVEVNDAFLRMTGFTREEAIGKTWQELTPPEFFPASLKAVHEVNTVGEATPYEKQYYGRDGRRWWGLFAPRRINDREVVEFVLDVTDRKLAEQAARESDQRFRQLTELSPALVWFSNPDGKLTYLNQHYYDLTGYTPEQALGDGWATALHPDDLPRVQAAWADARAREVAYETEFRLRRQDGNYRWYSARATAQRDDAGQIIGWLGSNADITPMKEAEQVLRASAEELERQVQERTRDRDRMWRLSTDVMLVADFQARIKAVNPAWTSLFGWTPDELVGGGFMSLVHPDDVASTLAEVGKLADGLTTLRFENRYRHKDGSYRWVSWTAVPDEQFIHAVGRDIQAEKEQAEALRQAEDALRQSQKMEAVGQLTGGIAHDFNNLLTGITGSLEILGTRIVQGRLSGLDRYIITAQGAANRAAGLTHRLLAFARQQTLDAKPTDANKLIHDMEDLIRRTVGPEIAVSTVLDPDLWTTRCDPNQLESAVLNLCINARDAMPDGGRLTIETNNSRIDAHGARVWDMRPGEYVAICVTDTGTGMPPEVIARAFDPFFTTKPLGQGTGLGLSMIYGFTRQSGGQVRIASEEGRGTTMRLYLPRHRGDAVAGEAPSQLADAPRAEAGQTVLVVDDEPSVRMLITEVLEELGYAAVEAADGASGLAVLRSDARIDLLVSDVGLPGGMNGRQLADAARQFRPGLKVLFITGYAEHAVFQNEHLEPGMQVLTKPFALEKLAERIKAIINTKPEA